MAKPKMKIRPFEQQDAPLEAMPSLELGVTPPKGIRRIKSWNPLENDGIHDKETPETYVRVS
ncbi:hypothetical protein KKF61_09015, partial [Patescibacteria group bacterium]|nr:hypothetical protein [Patescibacteria group bacterium]